MTREEFLEIYDLNINAFEEMKKATGYMKYLNDILPTSDGRTVAQRQYVSGLNFMFTQIMNKQTAPAGNQSSFDIRDLDFGQFVRDYEDVMSSDHLEKNDGTERKPYEGVELEAINSLLENAKSYKKSMNEILKDKVKNGADLGKLRKQSTYDERSDGFERKVEAKNAACTMYNVMKEVIGERTWAQRLNPLNWFRMIEENLYMRNLKNQIKGHIKREILGRDLEAQQNGYVPKVNDPTQSEINSYANTYDQGSSFYDVIEDDKITELENYKNERTEALEHISTIEDNNVQISSENRIKLDGEQLGADVNGKDVSDKADKIKEITSGPKEKTLD